MFPRYHRAPVSQSRIINAPFKTSDSGESLKAPLTYATGGFGSSSHLAVALFSFLSEAKFNHVPYKGAGPALADVVAGHVNFTVATMPGAIQQVRSGALRALGISSLTRSPELPDVPAIAE